MGVVLELGILGPLEVRLGGELAAPGGRRQRALLAILALQANEVVSTDRLIDGLWGENPPATAVHSIQVFVSRLRSALARAGDRLVTRQPGYLLELGPDELDASRCERLYSSAVAAMSTGDAVRAAGLLRDAEALWRGPPLAEFAYDAFAQAEIGRLEELRLSCREELIEAELALGRHANVISSLEVLVRGQPFRERPRRQLMLALYRCGRQADALDAYREARRVLVEQLGVEPGFALRELEQAILRQDPALGGPPSPTRPLPPRGPASDDRPADGDPGGAATMAPPASRKVVTVLACDVDGFTGTGSELDPEVRRDLMRRCFSDMRSIVAHHGGVVETLMHGAWLGVFGVPRLHEDDAVRAVRAALAIRDQLSEVAEQTGAALDVRVGLGTGLVVTHEGEALPAGEPLDVAARLAHAAPAGEILLAPETLRLVRNAVEVGPLPERDRSGVANRALEGAVRLLDANPTAPAVARHLSIKMVDRRIELARLVEAWERVCSQAQCHLFTLLGAAGVGKSRLVAELLSPVGEANVLAGRCLPYGEGITFWPLIEALGAVGDMAQTMRERLRSGGTATPEELFWEVRSLLESLARDRPVILHVDDLQWAEPMLLDLIEHVVDLSRQARILVLCTARLELYEERPSWGGGKLNATSLLLEPLLPEDCLVLLEEIGGGLDTQVQTRLVAASEGNPLFLEEMVAYAREQGTVSVPPTIQALLAARLERLPQPERELLQRAAVIGEQFDLAALHELAAESWEPQTESVLAALVRKDLVRPFTDAGPPNSFRFRHLLIRDAAYDGLPKAIRAELHRRYADWLQATAEDPLELDEFAGWHLEQTVRYQRDLGRERDAELARRGAIHLHAAGLRAGGRSDTAAASNLLERALALADGQEALQIRIGLDLAEQLIERGELQRADELLRAAEQAKDTTGLAALTRFVWLVRVRPDGATDTVRARLPGVLAQLARSGDERGLAKAHLAAREAEVMVSHATAAANAARLAARHAERAGDDGLRARALGLYITSIMYGRQNARAIARELASITPGEPGSFLAARWTLGQAELGRLEGRFDDARAAYDQAIEGFRTLGMPESEAACEADLARAELAAENPRAALAALARSDELLAGLRERSRRSTTQAHIAQAHVMLGNLEAAREAVERAESLGAPEDVLNFTITHQVRAWLSLARGESEAAERWARSAVDHALQTDYVVFQGNAALGLARIEAALGHVQEAVVHADAARTLFSSKGDRPGIEKAEALLEQLERTPASAGGQIGDTGHVG